MKTVVRNPKSEHELLKEKMECVVEFLYRDMEAIFANQDSLNV